MFQAFDVAAFRWINDGWSNPVFDVVFPFFNGGRFFIPMLVLAGVFLIWKGGRKARAYLICLIVAISITDGVVCNGLKKTIGRPRPFSTLENVNLLAGKGPSASMPSSHAGNWAAGLAVTFLFYRRSWRFMAPLAATVGVARIYSGVHYPSDVLVGWGLGLAVGWGTVLGAQRIWRTLIARLFSHTDSYWPDLLNPPSSAQVVDGSRPEPDWFRLGLVFILVLLLGRLIYLGSGIIELSEDEAYQWMWSKHPALSYFSKPPLIAYTQWLGRSLWGDREFAVRFFGPICAAGVSWMALLWLVREGKAKVGFIVLLVITATPIFAAGATLMTVDSISVLFWTAAMFAGYQAIRRESLSWWVWTGLALALSCLSKQTGLFQLISFVLVFFTWSQARRQLRTSGPWLALGISLLALVPVLVWNQQHGWITLEHLQNRAGLSARWEPTLRYLLRLTGEEFGLLNPIFFAGLILAAIRFLRKGSGSTELERFFFWMGAPLFVGYFAYSLRALVLPNWIAPSVLPLLIWMVLVLSRQPDWRRWIVWGKVGLVLGFVAMVCVHDTRFINRATGLSLPTKLDPHTRVRGWKSLAEIVNSEVQKISTEGNGVFVLADHYGLTSLLTFYIAEARANVPEKRMVFYPWTAHAENQYYFWESYTGRVGHTAIYVQQLRKSKVPSPIPEHLARQFESIEELGVRQVRFKDQVIREVQLFACRGLKPQSKW